MTKRGGRRKGAGRPKGTGNKDLQLVRDALKVNREALIGKAIKLALARKPNVPVLIALLRKVVPDLQATTIDATVRRDESFAGMSCEQMDDQILEYADEIRALRAGQTKPVPGGYQISGRAPTINKARGSECRATE